MPERAQKLSELPVYLLASIPQKKRELQARGVDVIDLGAGDADLSPPLKAIEALKRAVHEPAMQRYGWALGLPAYREAVSSWMLKRFGLSFDPFTEVVPLIGSKEGLSHLAFAYLDPGDITIIPEPGYPAYVGGTLLSNGTAYKYALRPRTKFLIEIDEVPAEVLRRAKMIYLNYPNNPTAAIAPREYLKRMVDRCRELDILLVYDNAYSELAFDGYRPPSIFEIEGAADVAIEFHSLSKTYNMTGWRCGWAVARPEIAAALAQVKTFVDTGPFMPIQAAGVAALESYDEFVPGNIAIFRERRDAAIDAFRSAGFVCEVPKATMYCWLALPEGLPSAAFAERLLMEEGVVLLPGSAFGAGGEGFVRVSFVTSPERIREAAGRAARVLAAFGAGIR
ncbi:MAG: aminotransferase class I/II-fold pyridoxal phosphate-dependent enzyme [Gemmatimonadaceae bacterium]|nr:aminotransferase class I/II-fold pyridoxal phosphate-dependent enzyme [Gemmatimonadaceae bacterium]MDQ3520638.1 aminotransferase class I/II-fold pyridoxal phosphate-dependent enzyme [Gemmatimonadota bacterium]